MSINPGGGNYGWNYSNPNKPEYSLQLVGTVLAIQEVQKRGYTTTGQPGAPQFWPDGNPMWNIRIAMATQDGSLKTFMFQPAGKEARAGRKKSVHMDLFALTGNTDMNNLVGKTICIQTQEGRYGQGNPRPWYVQLVDAGPYQLNGPLPAEFKAPQVLANAAASGGQVSAPQQQAYQPQGYQAPQPVPQPMPFQPGYQQHSAFNPQPAYQAPQPMQQAQPMYPQVQQAYQQPQAMDPAIAQAMAQQAFGGEVAVSYEQPAQPADPVGTGYVYDDDMPEEWK